MSDLVERLREEALEAHKEAWRRRDGGQEYTMGAILAEEAADRIEALEAALRPFCFFGDEPDTTQEAWEIRYRDRFKDWIDFEDIEAARAVMGPQP